MRAHQSGYSWLAAVLGANAPQAKPAMARESFVSPSSTSFRPRFGGPNTAAHASRAHESALWQRHLRKMGRRTVPFVRWHSPHLANRILYKVHVVRTLFWAQRLSGRKLDRLAALEPAEQTQRVAHPTVRPECLLMHRAAQLCACRRLCAEQMQERRGGGREREKEGGIERVRESERAKERERERERKRWGYLDGWVEQDGLGLVGIHRACGGAMRVCEGVATCE